MACASKYRSLTEYFFAHLEEQGDCLIWTGSRRVVGGRLFPQAKWKQRLYSPPRLAWRLAYGTDPPKGRMFFQTCGNPLCCNPEHIEYAGRPWAPEEIPERLRGHLLGHTPPENTDWGEPGAELAWWQVRVIVLAVVGQALQDATQYGGTEEAREWLATTGRDWMETVGFDANLITKKLQEISNDDDVL